MRSLYDTIFLEKDITLRDICHLEPFINALVDNQITQVSNFELKNIFPFSREFKTAYITTIEEFFNKEKTTILNSILSESLYADQIFETEVELMGDIGYIRYLFPIPYAKAYIEQSNINPVKVAVSQVYEYTRYIELDKNIETIKDEPIILLEYPYSEPGFFVLDGNHRVDHAYKNQLNAIDAYVFNEANMLLLVPSHFFSFLATVHRNLTYIGLYMIGDITLDELKKIYVPIVNKDI